MLRAADRRLQDAIGDNPENTRRTWRIAKPGDRRTTPAADKQVAFRLEDDGSITQ